ncbi:MAG: hypothetical protein ACOYYS_20485 [Chloroflexota bacterium]
MKRSNFLKIVLLAWLPFVIFACTSNSTIVPGTDAGTAQLPPQAVLETAARLSQSLNVSIESVEIVEFERVDWPNACLGVTREGQACADVITPGFRIVLNANDQQYEFRSNEDGSVIVEVTELNTPAP